MEKNALFLWMATFLLLSVVLVGAVSAAKPIPRLDTPILVLPENRAVLNTYPVTVTWEAVTGATIYTLQADCYDSSTHQWSVIYDMGTSAKTEDLWHITEACKGRWRVIARDGTAFSDSRPSKYSTFTFTPPPCEVAGETLCVLSPTSGGCVDLQTDINNCGACENECWAPNVADYSCTSGACSIASCSGAYLDCDGNFANGCEIDGSSDISNCGACENACSAANGDAFCNVGSCDILSCDSGWGDCSIYGYDDGCETDTTTVDNCGSCGNACSAANGDVSCNAGSCAIGTCDAGFADCDGLYANGCEIDAITNPNHCGFCGNVCSAANGDVSCNAGSCAIGTCDAGFADCDGLYANGCETNTNTDPDNCGGCSISSGFAVLVTGGTDCSVEYGTPYCNSGVCAIESCNTGYADCYNGYTDGCETNTNTDPNNCYSCGDACSTTGGTPSCSDGVCSISCNYPYADCNDDASAGSYSDGCEADLSTDIDNCGGCGYEFACYNENGYAECEGGSCQYECYTGWGDCTTPSSIGLLGVAGPCQTDLTGVDNCGSCANACSTNFGTPSCNEGICAISCESGYADCNHDAYAGPDSDGCETWVGVPGECPPP